MSEEVTGFDEYAEDYDSALNQGISVSGESSDFFVRSRIGWLAGHLKNLQEQPRTIMDYGCGTGSAAPSILRFFPNAFVIGLDVSKRCLEKAKRHNIPDRTSFLLFDEYRPDAQIDLAYSNGVFHHIPCVDRSDAVNYVYQSLRPGGLFALWENNPWNPGARYVMSRIPFDRDAIMLSASETRRLLRNAGFQILRTDFLFIFPRTLRWLRCLEPVLARFPIGAQYQVLCRKS